MDDGAYTYDLAVSFAGEQREYVEKFVRECEARGLRVLYDRDLAVDLWGRNVIFEFRKIYGGTRTRFVVPFISPEYLAKPYPMDEFAAAVEQGFQRPDAYILPVVMGDLKPPPELLNPAIGFLRADEHQPAQLAEKMLEKIGPSRPGLSPPPLRAPRITPTAFHPRAVLESTVVAVHDRFREAGQTLGPYGYTCRVTRDEAGIDIRVDQAGRPVCGMSLWFDSMTTFGDADRLAMSFGWPASSRSGMNGWVSAVWDPVKRSAAVTFLDFSRGADEQMLTVDQFIEVLWEKISDFLERRLR